MTLQNLLAIRQLQAHSADPAAVRKLVAKDDVIVLDALRRQRNITDYEGDPVSAPTLAACLGEVGKLLVHTEQWLREHRPELLGDA